MTRLEDALRPAAKARQLTAWSANWSPINQDVAIISASDGEKNYQFEVTGFELLQNDGLSLRDLLDCRISEALAA